MLPQFLNQGSPVNQQHPLNRGRVAWWLAMPAFGGCGHGSLTWRDLVRAYRGSLTSMTAPWRGTSHQGGFGNLLFDGAAGYVALPAGLLSSVYTVAVWFFATDVSSYHNIFSAYTADGNSVEIFVNNGPNLMGGNFSSAAFSAASSIAANTWYRVVLTSDGSTTKLYLNGSASGTTGSTAFSTFSVVPNLGTRGGSFFFPGRMDDVSLWSRALSASEAQQDYIQSRLGYPDALNWVRTPALLAQQAAAAGGGPFPHYIRRAMAGGMAA